jgi:YD repeat-containing protein
MRILLAIILLLPALQTFAQFDYDLFMSLSDIGNLQQNMNLSSMTEFRIGQNEEQTKTFTKHFDPKGLPTALMQYDPKGQVVLKKEFIYDLSGFLKSIETYKLKEHESSTEFEVNHLEQIISYTDYVYSSYDGTKTFVWRTILEYNPNSTLKKIIKLQGHNQDTSQVDFFNTNGVKEKTLLNMVGLRTVKIIYDYNNDSTEMLENHYQDATTIYNTITHKYKNKREIEKIDLTTADKPFYWKYDDHGRVIETNQDFYYVSHYKYNSEGFLISKIIQVRYSDSEEKELPKKIEFKYVYELR